MPFAPIEKAVEAIGRGEIVVVVDDADRENEGDLIVAAEFATPDKIAFFLNHTSGVICMPMLGERLDELELPPMVAANTESNRTAFTVSVDARLVTTTGISAADRAATIAALIDPATRPVDLARPGHVFPLRYREGGVLKRSGHTEAAVDLARMAGLYPAGVLCEVVTGDKTEMARLPELERFAADHGLLLITIADLIRYRRQSEKLVRAGGRGARSPPSGASSPATSTSPCSTATSTWPWCGARCRASRTCWCGSTPSASRATSSAPCAATAACSSRRRWSGWRRPGIGIVALPAGPRGTGHRPGPQAAGLRPPGPGPRHRRRQPPAGPARRQPGVRHRGPDPRRPGHHHHAPAHQQPGQVRRPRGLRPGDRRAGAAADGVQPREPALPAHQAAAPRPPPRGTRE